MAHEYTDCPAHGEIENLKRWQSDQNGSLRRLADSVQELCEHEAHRSGAEGMLKWIIGLVGFTGVVSIIGLIVGVVQ